MLLQSFSFKTHVTVTKDGGLGQDPTFTSATL